ncbi:Alpha/Beta hydrolase protein [Gymnopilus junonius]|uniref:triacylglycerol lipase n=1 Tax=Gymnopilus junonius TaxID=109634 RepID=A0A9P5N8T5_GYMJU|nr:Alpha/Beta hydrolase protein [Gymnopilus junonius]
MLLGLPVTLQSLITTFLWTSYPPEPDGTSISFQLRHLHAITNDSRIIFSDIKPEASLLGAESQFTIPIQNIRIPRPESTSAFHAARRNRDPGVTPALEWQDWDTLSPDVTKRSTLQQLAKMAFNTYAADNSTVGEWYDISDGWNSDPFGWQPEEDGMRGHVFVSNDNSTVVIAIKGTSTGWLVGGGGPTVSKDKKNDNLLFSCCCARVGPTWSTVCDCFDGGYRCDTDCVEEAMKDDGLFYPLGLNLYHNVTYLYPHANIWLTGHSLGGGLAALMGATFGAPVVAFEAPAERLAAQRLHLPSPPSTHHIVHVYNTADPIPMGTCTGVTSLCAIGGFALETRCHLGQAIRYDTVQKLGWSVDIRNHGIKLVIDRLLSDNSEWKEEFNGELEEDQKGWLSIMGWGWKRRRSGEEDEGGEKKPMREVPLARPASEVEGTDGVCTDCFNWKFGKYKNQTSLESSICP